MTFDEFGLLISQNKAVLVYYSTPECVVCLSLRPKIEEMLSIRFPRILFHYVDCVDEAELAAQNSIFAVPTIVFYLDGKEFIRKSRFVGVDELAAQIQRPYNLLFT